MSTVMSNQAPMKTLLGHALVRDEHGEEMHKSKGNAIWFDDAAEEMGADVMRWMFAGANPAVNIQFGPHHAAEVVRSFLLPLWNSYSFFVTYANLDGWQPADGQASELTVNDRWILSRLDGTTAGVRQALDNYDAAARHPGHRGLRRRPVELVHPPQSPPVLEGRARRRQACRLRDAA